MLRIRYGVVILSLFGVVLFFGTPFIATWFTRIDIDAINQIVIALRIDAFNQPALILAIFSWRFAGGGHKNTLTNLL